MSPRPPAHQYPPVAIIMGSVSDWAVVSHAARLLDTLGIAYSAQVISAHRTPELMYQFAEKAQRRRIKVIIAGAGGAAHLPGMVASITCLPVIGIPIPSTDLKGLDALLSIAQMPAHSPVATMAIGVPGAKNAALLATSILAVSGHRGAASNLKKWRKKSQQETLHSALSAVDSKTS